VIACSCTATHVRRRIVVTGGPGAGKTALLELVRQNFCKHVRVLPESASILFGGGFPRLFSDGGKRAGQRAIYHVQRELEAAVLDEDVAIVLCDRGTLDGLAYWPGDPADLWQEIGSSREAELSRYDAVIHLRTPGATGYNHNNPVRIETAAEAAAIDTRVAAAWEGHPRRLFVPDEPNFLTKASRALELLSAELPACCRHRVPGVDG
jgi:predicted ATPase